MAYILPPHRLQASMRERGKFEEETFVNVSGRTRNTSAQVQEQALQP